MPGPGPDAEIPENIERFDANGDVILVVSDQLPENTRRFLVSSKVLGLASSVFAKLFGPNFHEGIKLQNHTCPEVDLHGDDPAAMGAMVGILHYQEPNEIVRTDAQWLSTLAVQCDKYDCGKALGGWISAWLNQFQSIKTPEDYGNLILAAYLFRHAEHFSRFTLQAQLSLPPDFALKWEESEIMKRLPDRVKCRFANISFEAIPYYSLPDNK